MAQAPPKPVWHLLRTGERPCVVSDQELLVLAELGHLRADDLLWRPDFHVYRTVRSLLGHGRVAPAPSLILLSERSKRINVEAIPDFLGPVETTAPAQKLRSATLGGANRHIKLVGVVGLLIVVALVGVLGLAMHSSLAIEFSRQYNLPLSPNPALLPPSLIRLPPRFNNPILRLQQRLGAFQDPPTR